MGTVMQHNTHERARFFVSTRGSLMDRQATGAARRTGYSMAANDATRSEMQILADLLNEPGRGEALDAGHFPHQEWILRAERRDTDRRAPVGQAVAGCAA
jgi:hypothetical protein